MTSAERAKVIVERHKHMVPPKLEHEIADAIDAAVAAALEACAKIADQHGKEAPYWIEQRICERIAKEIRAQGKS